MPNTSLKLINIIGAGKLGKSLALDIQSYHLGHLQSICNRSIDSTKNISQHLKNTMACPSIEQLPNADFIFITTPDDAIALCAHELINNKNIKAGTVVVHCSGVLSSEILYVLKNKDCLIASLHPMRSFSYASGTTFEGAYCALEGDKEAIKKIKQLLKPLNINWLEISAQKKAVYHCGGVFSANYLIEILHQAQKAYQNAGLDETVALTVAYDLAQGVLNNIKKTNSLTNALTGPLARGDIQTILLHLNQLPPDSKYLYKALGKELLTLCDLPKAKRHQLEDLLAMGQD